MAIVYMTGKAEIGEYTSIHKLAIGVLACGAYQPGTAGWGS
jgi:hypothetical protein